ncbi:hypothetical protein ISO29_11455 [Staphylococcus haemolyticus]|uniref:hypothetical protein n=1 Tax=Staphylococcus aureus TaxID=1280 RepID=UPI00187F88F3|nr:hypothetical protein [Staphylococcus aureus]MBF2758297.1 hypothetical protein [Staphylococcus haemolyticus]MBF2774579.1 hypothetical protein [Staphylococcus haemolyticus]MBF2815515.1 hypothetical protein [Staphylococcus haemolyticus]MBF9721606.1 hypothetical protein [Staphylococcus haemolyticus]QOV87067.1 hypothetical protein IOD51_06235 [Staphylococcus haemolyticus]
MKVIALAHNITDEREDHLDKQPIDTVREYCKNNGLKITKIYNEESTLVDDINDNHIKPKRVVFWGTYEDYPKLDKLCSKRKIKFITIFPMLV